MAAALVRAVAGGVVRHSDHLDPTRTAPGFAVNQDLLFPGYLAVTRCAVNLDLHCRQGTGR